MFAGVRKKADGDALAARASNGLTPVTIDITSPASISAAAATVSAAVGKRGLAGLVNNAGIVKPAPLEHQPLADFRRQLEVNLVGPLAVTQAFLPLIRLGRGRIVNVGSIGGRVVLPLHGAYSCSKFGMEALSDALRLELRQWKIPVVHVDPGATDTAIFGKTLAALDGLESMLGPEAYKRYAGTDRGDAEDGREDGCRHGPGARARESHCEGAHGRQAEVSLPRREGRRRGHRAGPGRLGQHQGPGDRPRGGPAEAGVILSRSSSQQAARRPDSPGRRRSSVPGPRSRP